MEGILEKLRGINYQVSLRGSFPVIFPGGNDSLAPTVRHMSVVTASWRSKCWSLGMRDGSLNQ